VITLTFPHPTLSSLRTAIWHEHLESVAILLCVPVRLGDSQGWRLIVRETHVAPDDAYEERTEVSARLSPAFGLPFEKRAHNNGWSIVYCHTHPHQRDDVEFSRIDDAAEIPLARYANDRSAGVPHLALLIAHRSMVARRLASTEPARVLTRGSKWSSGKILQLN
jgi:molybdopterin-synthase adenylyltransferase